MRNSPLHVRTLDRTTYTQVIHDECVLGHPLQLVPSCRNVGVYWYLCDSHIPDQDPYVVGHVLEFTSLDTHIVQVFSTAIASLVKLIQENFSLFQPIFTLVNFFFTRFNSSFLKLKASLENYFLQIRQVHITFVFLWLQETATVSRP